MIDRVDEPGPPLEGYGGYLHQLLASKSIDPRLRGRIDPADVVQQVMVKALARWDQFRGRTPGERAAWLKAILANYLIDLARECGRIPDSLERSLGEALERSSARLEGLLAAEQSSPSEAVMRQEAAVRLARALERLPEDQRIALELRHLRDLPVPEVARRMGRTTAAAAGLLRRGLAELRVVLAEAEPS